MNYIIKPAVSLFVAAAITVAALSLVYNKTYESIEKQKSKVQEKAMMELLPQAESFSEMQFQPIKSINSVYEGYSGDNAVGYILKLTPSGYSGEIEFLAGVSIEKKRLQVYAYCATARRPVLERFRLK